MVAFSSYFVKSSIFKKNLLKLLFGQLLEKWTIFIPTSGHTSSRRNPTAATTFVNSGNTMNESFQNTSCVEGEKDSSLNRVILVPPEVVN